jgi:teichuronic acid biosynthesis protein TuaE
MAIIPLDGLSDWDSGCLPPFQLPCSGLDNRTRRGPFLKLLQHARIPVYRIEKVFCYLAFVTGFFGTVIFPIDLGLFTLFPYRIFLVLLWGLFGARALVQGKVTLPLGQVKPYMVFFSTWVFYGTLSLAWATSKGDAVRHLIFLFMGVSLIFFVVYYFSALCDLENLCRVWLGVFCVLIVLGLWEHLTGNHLPVSGFYGETRTRFMYRPTGVFRNPNDYATFLALSIPFVLSFVRYTKAWLIRIVGVLVVGIAFYLITVTGSRANILAVLLVMAFLFLFLTDWKQKAKIVLIGTIFSVIVVFGWLGPVREVFLRVFAELSSLIVQEELGYGSVLVRTNLVRNGLEFLCSTIGLGVGAGNAEYWMANFARYDTQGILNLHNWWLEVLVNYGVFIFVGYVITYLGLIRSLWCRWRRTKDYKERMVCEALLVALIGFSVASTSSSSIMAFAPQWMLFALALASLNYRRRDRKVAVV